jgi:purine nucleosidase
MRPILFDTDPGVDDAIALAYLLGQGECELVAVTTVHGNAPLATTTENAHALLLGAGADAVPVAAGAARPIAQLPAYAPHVHGQDGLGGARHRLPDASGRATGRAVPTILEQSRRFAGALEIVAVGPLTNLALALLADPELPARVRTVYVMGGAFDVPGNVTHAAEANIYHDPEAADLVFSAPWRVVAVGLDVTLKVTFEADDLEALRTGRSPFVAALGEMATAYAGVYRRHYGRLACAQHDALAALSAFEPDVLTTEDRPVRVELRGTYTRGMTVSLRPGADGPATNVAVGVHVDAVRARERILAAIGRLAARG